MSYDYLSQLPVVHLTDLLLDSDGRCDGWDWWGTFFTVARLNVSVPVLFRACILSRFRL